MAGTPYAAGGIRRTVAATRAASDDELRAPARRLRRRAARAGHDDVRGQDRLRPHRRTTRRGSRGSPPRSRPRSRSSARTSCRPSTPIAATSTSTSSAARCSQRLRAAQPLDRRVLRARRVHRRREPAHPRGRHRARPAAARARQPARPRRGRAARGRAGRGIRRSLHLPRRRRTSPRSPARDTVATLLPGVEFSTRQPYPDARRLLDAGVTVALASDCNPGSSFTSSMPLMIALAVREMGMTTAEAVWAATAGGAARAAPRRRRRRSPRASAPTSCCWTRRPARTSPTGPGVPLIRTVWKDGVAADVR